MCTIASLHAQWTSEGTGRTYTLMDLAETEGTGVTFNGDTFYFSGDVTINGDNLVSLGSPGNIANIIFTDGVTLELVQGVLDFDWVDIDSDGDYAIRIGETQNANINHTNIRNCGGITVYDAHVTITESEFHDFSTTFVSSAISLMNSTATISGCNFNYNAGSAIGSPANGSSAPKIIGCTFGNNVTENTNRPQINLGPCENDTILISNCVIYGGNYDKVGGISIANLMGGNNTTNIVIDSCEISGNRYGINLQGYNINALITNNKIENNDMEVNPMNGGSGISIYGVDENCKAKLRNNVIAGNLWGITSINKNDTDLGTADDLGGNYIYNNGNDGVTYALYNNASTDISAIGNYWGTNNANEAEDVIFHRPDLGETYGLVTFEPVMEAHPRLISLVCLAEDNCDEVPVPDCKNGNCDSKEDCFLQGDITGNVNEYQHTVYLYYNGVLEEYEEDFRNLTLRYILGEACSGTPESGEGFHFDDLWQSQLVISTPDGETETWTIQLMETESIAEQETERLTITPIPAREKVQIDMDVDTPYIITDLTGRTVCKGKSAGESTEINVQNWNPGIYIIKTQKNGKEKTGRIVVF